MTDRIPSKSIRSKRVHPTIFGQYQEHQMKRRHDLATVNGGSPRANGTPTEGSPRANGTPTEGSPRANGTPTEGSPRANGTPTEGSPRANGTPTEGSPRANGTPTEGSPRANGTPTAEEPSANPGNNSEQHNDRWVRVRKLMTAGSTCECHAKDKPAWALNSTKPPQRCFWWLILVLCIMCGIWSTIMVILEFIDAPTATSTTIRLVPSLELPAITVCPKVPDAYNFTAMYKDMQEIMRGRLTEEMAKDLISYWIGGSGLENMDALPKFNESHFQTIKGLYDNWRQGIDAKSFFHKLQAKYGYKCTDLFYNCELGGENKPCCGKIFHPKPVVRRGLCYQTLRNINQTEADDIGRLVLELKSPPSITSPQYNFAQPQIIIYINDNFEQVLDFPRFYLYPNEWNRMHITARMIELLEHPSDCSNNVFGKDSNCFVRNWLSATVIGPHNCTVPYLDNVEGVRADIPTCDPIILARKYEDVIQRVHAGSVHHHDCIPGCKRWEYSVSLQQSPSLQPFANYSFNLEVSFYDLQFENVEEIRTITFPGFMSQIGGQFGFYLGLSIVTMIQVLLSVAKLLFQTIGRILALFVGNAMPKNGAEIGQGGREREGAGERQRDERERVEMRQRAREKCGGRHNEALRESSSDRDREMRGANSEREDEETVGRKRAARLLEVEEGVTEC
uniref:Uncharacterized protein n=1 Tax=Globodera rostochiensis TaxID=31243 RepID=A0A914H2D0_GLORO